LSLDDFENDINESIIEWSKAYTFQIENIESTHKSVLIRLSSDIPIRVVKALDVSDSLNKSSVDLPSLDATDSNLDYKPCGIEGIYTEVIPATGDNQPSAISLITVANQNVYLERNRLFWARFTFEDKIQFTPTVPDNTDTIYVNFQYDWRLLNQFPDAFKKLYIYAMRIEIIQELFNASAFSDVSSSSFRELESKSPGNIPTTMQMMLENAKDDYIEVLNKLDTLYRTFKEYDEG
jgi:hypothetical protein